MKNNNLLPVLNGDRIDLVALMKNVWKGRIIILSVFIFFVGLGFFVALFSPVKYRSGSVLLPQSEGQQDLGQLGGLASLAGVNLGEMVGNSTGIPPELYPNIVSSFPFLYELVYSEFIFEGESKKKTLYQKMDEDMTENVLRKYTIALPRTLYKYLFSDEKEEVVSSFSDTTGLVAVSRRESSILNELLSSISVEVNTKTGLISVSVSHSEAYASAQIAQRLVDLLQQYIIDYKTSQVRNSLEFVEARYNEKKLEFEKAQRLLFEYKDAHRNMVSERIDPEFQELSDNYSVTQAVYQNLAQQLEQTRLTVKKETPAFTIIEPVKIPLEKSEPRRLFILLFFSLIGILVGFALLYGIHVYNKFVFLWQKS